MPSRDRRAGYRVHLEIFLNQQMGDRFYRGLTCNISETGLYLHTVISACTGLNHRTVGLEFELPDAGETIWARGEICYEHGDAYGIGRAVRFTAMAEAHAKMLADFCTAQRTGATRTARAWSR